jgi:hypothetical protein
MTAQALQVIVTDIELRGTGIDEPFRRVTQFWAPDGTLLAERDPILTIDETKKAISMFIEAEKQPPEPEGES